MGDPVRFDFPTASAPTASLVFNPTLVTVIRPRPMPIQQIELAVSGRAYRRQLHTNIEELWEISFDDLHEADSGGLSGYDSLRAFILNTAESMLNTFEVTDSDGDSMIGFYLRGLETFVEGGTIDRPQGILGQWSGTIVFRKDL